MCQLFRKQLEKVLLLLPPASAACRCLLQMSLLFFKPACTLARSQCSGIVESLCGQGCVGEDKG